MEDCQHTLEHECLWTEKSSLDLSISVRHDHVLARDEDHVDEATNATIGRRYGEQRESFDGFNYLSML